MSARRRISAAEARRRADVQRSMALMGRPGTGITLRFMAPESLCPDSLGLDYLADADTLRGHAVRAFFWLMRAWPKPSVKR